MCIYIYKYILYCILIIHIQTTKSLHIPSVSSRKKLAFFVHHFVASTPHSSAAQPARIRWLPCPRTPNVWAPEAPPPGEWSSDTFFSGRFSNTPWDTNGYRSRKGRWYRNGFKKGEFLVAMWMTSKGVHPSKLTWLAGKWTWNEDVQHHYCYVRSLDPLGKNGQTLL